MYSPSQMQLKVRQKEWKCFFGVLPFTRSQNNKRGNVPLGRRKLFVGSRRKADKHRKANREYLRSLDRQKAIVILRPAFPM